jgi:hypothetical protein
MNKSIQEVATEQIALVITLPDASLGLSGSVPFAHLVTKAISRALLDKGVLNDSPRLGTNGVCVDVECHGGNACAFRNQAIGIFYVTDLKTGLAAIHSELKSLELLNQLEIGFLDTRESFWRIVHPSGAPTRFEEHLALPEKWVAILRRTLK